MDLLGSLAPQSLSTEYSSCQEKLLYSPWLYIPCIPALSVQCHLGKLRVNLCLTNFTQTQLLRGLKAQLRGAALQSVCVELTTCSCFQPPQFAELAWPRPLRGLLASLPLPDHLPDLASSALALCHLRGCGQHGQPAARRALHVHVDGGFQEVYVTEAEGLQG